VLTRLGRGIAIAIPAIGGVFAALITLVDFRRSRREIVAGNAPAGRAFGVAAVCDSLDFVAHMLTTAGLSGALAAAIAVDPHFVHDIVHLSETASVVSAVVATGSAIAGEFLSVNKEAVVTVQEELAANDKAEEEFEAEQRNGNTEDEDAEKSKPTKPEKE
jgi:hypothetical protein